MRVYLRNTKYLIAQTSTLEQEIDKFRIKKSKAECCQRFGSESDFRKEWLTHDRKFIAYQRVSESVVIFSEGYFFHTDLSRIQKYNYYYCMSHLMMFDRYQYSSAQGFYFYCYVSMRMCLKEVEIRSLEVFFSKLLLFFGSWCEWRFTVSILPGGGIDNFRVNSFNYC